MGTFLKIKLVEIAQMGLGNRGGEPSENCKNILKKGEKSFVN